MEGLLREALRETAPDFRGITVLIRGYCAKPKGEECPTKLCLNCIFFTPEEIKVEREKVAGSTK